MSNTADHPPAAGILVEHDATPCPAPCPAPYPAEPPRFDANGFDPAEFEWRPVARRPRSDGWTPEVQRGFIQALAETGLVQEAAHAVDMSVQSAYRLRTAPGSEGFARAWAAALHAAADRIADLAFARAIEGEEVPVFDQDGVRIGAKRRVNDRMVMFLLRAHRPDRYGVTDRGSRVAAPSPAAASPAPESMTAAAPAPELSLPDALAALGPVSPADPHRTMAPAALERAVDTARLMAEVYDRYPVDERDPYVPPRVPADHDRRPPNRHRRRQRAAREKRGNDPFSA